MKWTLVTGAAKGLGAQICLALAKRGHSILVHYLKSAEEADKVVEECQSLGVDAKKIQGDFSTTDLLQQFLDKVALNKKIVNVVNNVGNYLIKSSLQTSLEEWIQLFQVNFFAPMALIRSCIESLKESQGNIINVGVTGMNSFRSDTYSTAYSITKSSLLMLTKSLAKELAPHLVSVNMVSPGELTYSVDKQPSLPMKRPGTSEEVARVVAFLLEQENHYITGQNIEIAGGLRL